MIIAFVRFAIIQHPKWLKFGIIFAFERETSKIMNKFLPFFALIALFALGSCKHYCHTNPFPALRLSGFDSADLNTVIVITSSSTGGPTVLPPAATTIYTSRHTSSSDTMYLSSKDTANNTFIPLDFNTNASIFIPATGRTYVLRGYAIVRESWESVNCTNGMAYYLNDTLHSQGLQPNTAGTGYIDIRK